MMLVSGDMKRQQDYFWVEEVAGGAFTVVADREGHCILM